MPRHGVPLAQRWRERDASDSEYRDGRFHSVAATQVGRTGCAETSRTGAAAGAEPRGISIAAAANASNANCAAILCTVGYSPSIGIVGTCSTNVALIHSDSWKLAMPCP